MKMPIEVFNGLVCDLEAVCSFHSIKPQTKSDMWSVFNHVMFQRSNDDSHPSFQKGLVKRVVGQDLTKYRDGGSASDLFYTKHDMNDVHIETALRKWMKEYHGAALL